MRSEVKNIMIALVSVLLALIVPASALAVGTAANTTVNNTATLKYTVGGGAEISFVNSTSFVVDRKVNFTVTNLVSTTVQPGVDNLVLSFFVNNAGNDAQSFILDVWADGGDDFDMNDVRVYIDNGAVANSLDGTDVAYTAGSGARAFNLNRDEGIRVILVANTPLSVTDGQAANYHLIANATDYGTNSLVVNTPGANTAGLDTVIADGAGGVSDNTGTADVQYNNAFSALGTYTVSSANINFVKVVNSVVWDPVNLNNGNQKAIPGAYVAYDLTITNYGGGSSAIIANIADSLTSNMTLIDYMDTNLNTATPSSSTTNQFIIECSVPTDNRACEGAGGTSTDAATVGASSFLLNMLTALPSEGAGPLAAGEIAPGDRITIHYMLLVP